MWRLRIFLLLLSSNLFSTQAVNVLTPERNRACNVLIAIDTETVFPDGRVPNNEDLVQNLLQYITSLNKIYEGSILKNPPNQNIYFRLTEIWMMSNFVPNCKNESVVLKQFSQFDFSGYCLAHLLTYRDFGCIVGLATVGGLCKPAGNTGFTKTRLNLREKNSTVNTMAHEIAHNFGSEHDGGKDPAYAACDPKKGDYIMGGGSEKFSSCSLQAMQARLHQIIKDPKVFSECFKPMQKGLKQKIEVDVKVLPNKEIACPLNPRPDDDDCKNPDPDDPPPPPPDPVCGNGVLEHPEECDCGPNHEVCRDPCCYPAELSEDDLYRNETAAPCKRFTHHPCNTPYWSPLVYGIIYSWLFLLILAVITGVVLLLDWKNKRKLYGHIINHDEDIRINTEANRTNGKRF